MAPHFNVVGEANDRTSRGAHAVSLLIEAGMPDQFRAAREAAMKKAWLALTPGLHESPRGQVVAYGATVYNRGPHEAEDVRVQLVDETGVDYGEPFIVGNIPADHQRAVRVTCPFPHETISVRLTWTDGRGYQSKTEAEAYAALPARSS